MIARVLLAVSDHGLRRKLRSALDGGDAVVDVARGGGRLWERLADSSADVIVVGRHLIPAPVSETINSLRGLPESPEVVVIAEHEDPGVRAALLGAGSAAVVNSGLSVTALREVLAAVLAKRAELVEGAASAPDVDVPRLSDFVSISPAMQTFMGTVNRVVASSTSLLILGETGVGKERLARAIHAEGPRSLGPFVAVNCGALAEGLLESELFGHEEGAFTGATRSRRGCFEVAHGGTIFLDEIGEMPTHLQVKLLRVLQEREVQRVGSERTVPVDVRIMAASNQDLTASVEAGSFRRDLYYRLGVVTLTVPPLRERREDIPTLVDSYVSYLRPRVGVDVHAIDPDALEAMTAYPWPGNVRELVNVVERAMLLSRDGKIGTRELPEAISGQRETLLTPVPAPTMLTGAESGTALSLPADWLDRSWRELRATIVAELEMAYLAGLLRRAGGRVGKTARMAGIRPRSLFEKMRRHGLHKEDFRPAAEQEG